MRASTLSCLEAPAGAFVADHVGPLVPEHLAFKNANHLLKQIMKEVDTNRDGKIQYEGIPPLETYNLFGRVDGFFFFFLCGLLHYLHCLRQKPIVMSSSSKSTVWKSNFTSSLVFFFFKKKF